MKHHKRLAALLAVAAMTLTAVAVSPAIAEDGPGGTDLGHDPNAAELVITSDFIGVVDEAQEAIGSAGVTITWSGSRSGSVRVIWTSVQIELDEGLAAQYIGSVTSSELATVRSDLATFASGIQDGSTANSVIELVCSLNVPNPYWDSATDSASAGVFQACTGDLVEQRVKGQLLMKRWWIFYSTKAQGDSGWSVSDNVAISMSKECGSSDRKDWRNKGQGIARSTMRMFETPWYPTDDVPLGCKA